MTERELIKGCQRGKRKHQKALVESYSALLMTVCRGFFRDEATAKDVLQEAFIQIFTHIHQYKPTGSFVGWMRRITVNTALKTIRKQDVIKDSVEIEEAYGIYRTPEAVSNLETEEIIQLIQKLPTELGVVFNLYVIEGYNHKEIGDQLGIKESTSRSYLSRARQLLQEYFFKAAKIRV